MGWIEFFGEWFALFKPRRVGMLVDVSKSAKRRKCPVVGGEITAAECGMYRLSKYACPEGCEFNPFAGERYHLIGEMEGGVVKKWQERLFDPRTATPDFVGRISKVDKDSTLSWAGMMIAESRFEKDSQGRSFADRWALEGWTGLKNDEQVMFKAMSKARLSLLEVQRVLDGERVEMVDLLRPEVGPMLFCDVSIASVACRFSTVLTFCCQWPHYWRFMGDPIVVRGVAGLSSGELIQAVFRHLDAPQDSVEGDLTRWFCAHITEFDASFDAAYGAQQTKWLQGLDAEVMAGIYEITGSYQECVRILASAQNVKENQVTDEAGKEGFVASYVMVQGESLLGQVLLGQRFLRLESITLAAYEAGRKEIERLLGGQLKFTKEHRVNVAGRLKESVPTYDPKDVPEEVMKALETARLGVEQSVLERRPGMTETAGKGENLRETFARRWLEESVPAFGGKTPREASKDPSMKSAVVREVKEWIRMADEENRDRGGSVDLNWMWDEVGFPEWKREMPPARFAGGVGEDEEDELEDPLERWPQPPLKPWTTEEIESKFDALDQIFPTLGQAEEAMEWAGGEFVSHMESLADGALCQEEMDAMAYLLTRVWFCFVPPGHYGPSIKLGEFGQGVLEKGERVLNIQMQVKAGKAVEGTLWQDLGQPSLLSLVVADLMDFLKQREEKLKTKAERMPLMVMMLWSAVDLMDKHCREGRE